MLSMSFDSKTVGCGKSKDIVSSLEHDLRKGDGMAARVLAASPSGAIDTYHAHPPETFALAGAIRTARTCSLAASSTSTPSPLWSHSDVLSLSRPLREMS